MRTIQPWVSGGTQVKTDQNGIGVRTIGTGVAVLTDAMIIRDTTIGIQATVVTDGGTTEVDIDENAGQGRGRRGHNPGIGIAEDSDGLGRE